MRFAVALCIGVVPLLGGCPPPPVNPTPENSTGGDTPEPSPPSPPIEGSVCEQLSAGGGLDESAGSVECPIPGITSEAVKISWYPDRVVKRKSRSSVFFFPKNLLQEEIVVVYEVTVNMKGEERSMKIPLPDRYSKARYHGGSGGTSEVDLQLGYSLNLLTEGPAEVHLWGSLRSPVRTPMMELAKVVVTAKMDEDDWVYDIDYLEW